MLKGFRGVCCIPNGEPGDIRYWYEDSIEKSNQKGKQVSVPTDYFNNDNYSFLSSVLYSRKIVLNSNADDCNFIPNPYARNRVSESFTEYFRPPKCLTE